MYFDIVVGVGQTKKKMYGFQKSPGDGRQIYNVVFMQTDLYTNVRLSSCKPLASSPPLNNSKLFIGTVIREYRLHEVNF